MDAESRGVLVTGGAGYIGSHACKALRRSGYRVVVFDSLVAGHRDAVRYGDFVLGDIADTGAVRTALGSHQVSAVMHFAAFLDVGASVRDPIGYYRNNVGGALSVLEAMAAESVKHFVFSSTCAVYGEPVETPISEGHPKAPINAYGQTKLTVEQALPHFETAYGIRWTGLRYFNAAGADPDGEIGEDHSPEIHVIPRAIDSAVNGSSFAIYGDDYPTPDGTCLRDYIHVSDLASAHVKALDALVAGSGSDVYNLGTGHPHSVKDVISAVEKVTGRKVPWTLGPRRPGDPAVLYAAAGKAAQHLNWTPKLADLETIVQTAWQWHRTHPAGYKPAAHS